MSETGVLWATGLMSVGAIVAAPLIALWVQRISELEKARTERQQSIFRVLWVNRRRPFYLARVDALNMIDVDFYGERRVQDAWDDLRAHYFKLEHPGLNDTQIAAEREEKFATLLFEISQVLGYKFGRTQVRDNIYRPQLHNDFEEMEYETRKHLFDILRGNSIPVRLIEEAEPRPPIEAPTNKHPHGRQ